MKAQKIRTGIAEAAAIILTIIVLAPFLLVVVNSAKTKWSNFVFMLFVSAMVIPFQVVMLPLLSSLMLGLNGKIKTLPVAVSSFVGSYVKQWDLILPFCICRMMWQLGGEVIL